MMKDNPLIHILIAAALIAGVWKWYDSGLEPPEQPILLVAYNDLTDEEESLIQLTPKDSEVEITVVDEAIKKVIDSGYTKKLLYKVTFRHTETQSAGNLVLYVDMNKEAVVGRGFDEKSGAYLK
ncbi:hypothetical protein [Planococcus ruber]|uniref:hypothetical protein n=1 Tax=Planococcus ruber TaxID=2027871 RepID=UPI001FEF650A|nr:hypothetical protein [Planococcus ruber]MCJ1907688.1 hypothetical protein [Planococcus ruber]